MLDMAKSPAAGLQWRSHPIFILSTVAIGQFTDLFLYGLMIPVLPFLLRDRLDVPPNAIQGHVSLLLAAFSAGSLVFSVPAGWLADWTTNRQTPYLLGLVSLMAATIALTFAQSFLLLFVSRVLQGLSAAVVYATGLAMAIDTVGPNSLGRTLGTVGGRRQVLHVILLAPQTY
jgi:MFS family permease